jgi:hypothetical protein
VTASRSQRGDNQRLGGNCGCQPGLVRWREADLVAHPVEAEGDGFGIRSAVEIVRGHHQNRPGHDIDHARRSDSRTARHFMKRLSKSGGGCFGVRTLRASAHPIIAAASRQPRAR